MFCITIAMGNTAWRLMYKSEEKATEHFAILVDPDSPTGEIKLKDDYGQICAIRVSSIHGFMFEDLEKSKLANVELFLHQQRVQNMAQKAAQSDPGLRASSLMGSPRVLDPMGRQN